MNPLISVVMAGAVAQDGYQRTLREHTYVHRFSEIFQKIGLPDTSPREVLKGNLPVGRTEDVTISRAPLDRLT
jgi:hypothetical protein